VTVNFPKWCRVYAKESCAVLSIARGRPCGVQPLRGKVYGGRCLLSISSESDSLSGSHSRFPGNMTGWARSIGVRSAYRQRGPWAVDQRRAKDTTAALQTVRQGRLPTLAAEDLAHAQPDRFLTLEPAGTAGSTTLPSSRSAPSSSSSRLRARSWARAGFLHSTSRLAERPGRRDLDLNWRSPALIRASI